jgi:sulfatase maturation enzyme AslB (radical SAM superfamily)
MYVILPFEKEFYKKYNFDVSFVGHPLIDAIADRKKVNEAKFSFSEDQVKDVAELIAKAIAKMDKAKTAVHDMEYDAGRGAGFEISMDGEKYDGGSYTVRPNGEVYNAAIGNSFPNAIYAKIGDKDINKIIKNIKKLICY